MQLKFSIRSSTHYLGFLRQLLSNICKEINCDHKVLLSCSLALVEAVNNAIFHAHKKNINKWIDVAIITSTEKIEIIVTDYGPGFDMPEYAIPPVDHTHGRGLFIIKSMMHEVEYRRGKKNILRMVYCL